MNIWIIDHYSSEPKYGGISRQYDFAKELSKRNNNVLVVSSSFSHFTHSYISEVDCYCTEISEKAHYAYVKTTPYKDNSGLKRIINTFSFLVSVAKKHKYLMNMYGKPDIVVGCSVHPFTWIIANYVAKKYKARFFVEVRDLWPENQIDDEGMSPYHPVALALGTLEKWAYSKADKIIYSMSKGNEYICDILGYPQEKTIWIGQPMDCERFDVNATRYNELDCEIKEFIGDAFLCVYTGYYMDYEGVHEMLRAAKIVKDDGLPVKFLFVGSGIEKERMKSYAEDNALDNVFIGDRINKELIPALIRRANICLAHLAERGNENSYRYDASKNKLNEYMYSDSCIIYGTHVKNQFVETSGAGYTIEPFSAEAFADKIAYVFNQDEETRMSYGKNGKNFILQNNTVEKLVDKYITLF